MLKKELRFIGKYWKADEVLRPFVAAQEKRQEGKIDTTGINIFQNVNQEQLRRPKFSLIGIISWGLTGYLIWLIFEAYKGNSTGSAPSSSMLPRIGSNPLSQFISYTPKVAVNVSQRLIDLKGMEEITEEITNLIKMIKFPQKYISKGAKVPKGLLLYGKPGTGIRSFISYFNR